MYVQDYRLRLRRSIQISLIQSGHSSSVYLGRLAKCAVTSAYALFPKLIGRAPFFAKTCLKWDFRLFQWAVHGRKRTLYLLLYHRLYLNATPDFSAGGGRGGGQKQRAPQLEPPDVKINDQVKGTISRIEPYGLFITIEEGKKDALLHVNDSGQDVAFTEQPGYRIGHEQEVRFYSASNL